MAKTVWFIEVVREKAPEQAAVDRKAKKSGTRGKGSVLKSFLRRWAWLHYALPFSGTVVPWGVWPLEEYPES